MPVVHEIVTEVENGHEAVLDVVVNEADSENPVVLDETITVDGTETEVN